jgi:hypothetical protein
MENIIAQFGIVLEEKATVLTKGPSGILVYEGQGRYWG